MRKLGLKVKKFTRKSRRYRSYKGTVGTVAKNRINRRFHTNVCLQKLATDMTEFKCSDGRKLYLSPIMDMYNGEILSYGISNRPTLDLVIKPLEEALQMTKEAKVRTTLHSDQAGTTSIGNGSEHLSNTRYSKACPAKATAWTTRRWKTSSAY